MAAVCSSDGWRRRGVGKVGLAIVVMLGMIVVQNGF